VVATPLLAAIITSKLPPRGVIIGVPLALVGAAFIAGPPEGGLSAAAWATIACAVVFGGHILVTDVATRRADPMALTFTMFVYSVLWLALAFVIAPGGIAALTTATLGQVFTSADFVLHAVLCAFFASVIAISVLNRWQKELHPSRAAIVYTAEPVFATLISMAYDRDQITGWLVFGAAMILLANVAAEFIRPRKQALPA
jgi:drug/metabolite transporter (DMT)-like permease